jgi:HD-like signal output (HDOD) protein
MDNAFERFIKEIGIPPCPDILIRIMEETSREEPDYNHLATIISADVALSAGLFKTANSSYFGSKLRARSVRDALAILGLRAASRAVAGIILRHAFPNSLIMERFWDASARVARLSGWMAQQLKLPELTPEDAYTFGLFRDCGIPILLRHSPGYEKVLFKANNDSELGFTSIEDATLPTNHAIVGSILAEDWRLPSEMYLAIRQHHELKLLNIEETRLPLLSRRLIAVAQLSEHILQHQLGLSFTQEWPKLGPACLQLLNISEEYLIQLYEAAQPVVSAATE